jgi:anti-sigma regulatory factor (Ser/Thr protein kinase)
MLIGEPPEGLRAARAASYSEASQGIDGDFFAFTTLREDCLELLVGDVMGKGVPAALVGAAVRTAYNQVVTELLSASLGSGELPSPERVVNTLHARLTPRLIELDVFVTLALYRFDFSTDTIRYVNAGHTEGLILRADGRVAGILGENLPLGVIEAERYVERSVPLAAGDALVVYSDGLTEARNAQGTTFGDERVRSTLIEAFRLGLPPNICLQALRRAAREFGGGGQLVDDQTVAMVAVPPRRDEKRGSTDVFDLPWEARKLEPLRTRVAAAATVLGPTAADGLVLASFEAATNVVRHVTQPFPDALLSCRIECGADEVSVEIWYLGAAFAPPAEPTPDFSGESEGGFGLYIMQQAVSRVCHESPMPGVCCTRLVQSIAGRAAA